MTRSDRRASGKSHDEPKAAHGGQLLVTVPRMVTLDDVATMALELPGVNEILGGHGPRRQWQVAGKTFAWERPLTKADIKRFGEAGETPPDGEIVGVRVEDLDEKAAVLAEGRKGFFTMAHFNNYPAILIQLKVAKKTDIREALLDGWLSQAPPKLAAEHMAKKKRRV